MPVATSACPAPSRLSTTSTRLSRVWRVTCAERGVMGVCCIVRWMVSRAYLLAACMVLPLLAAVVGNWSGSLRVALADPVLGALSAMEQPLSVRSLGGPRSEEHTSEL